MNRLKNCKDRINKSSQLRKTKTANLKLSLSILTVAILLVIFGVRSDAYAWTSSLVRTLNTSYGAMIGADILQANDNNTNALLVKYGLVGIGTLTPAYKLDVNGDLKITGNIRVNTDGTGADVLISTYKGANSAGSNLYVGGGGQSSVGAVGSSYLGSYNTAFGLYSLYSNTAGNLNVAYGMSSLFTNTTGEQNTAIGINALYNNTTGSYNTATGYESLLNNTSGYKNVAYGIVALHSNTTGWQNTAIGINALYNNTTGSYNTALGSDAGAYTASNSVNSLSSNSVFLGDNTRVNAIGQINQIVIGSNAIGIGNNSVVLGDNNIVTTALKGKVGIGTTTPAYKLDVNGEINASSYLVNGTPLSSSTSQWTTTGNNIYYNTGNVGVGITNPSNKFIVAGPGDNFQFIIRPTGSGGSPYGFVATDINSNTLGAGKLMIYDIYQGARMTIDSSGNVGINTKSPSAKLDVDGQGGLIAGAGNLGTQSTIPSSLASSGKVLIGWNKSGGRGEIDLVSNRGAATAGNGNGGFSFYDYANDGTLSSLMTINNSGLAVSGDTTSSNLSLTNGYIKSGNGTNMIDVDYGGSSAAVRILKDLTISGILNVPQICLNADCKAAWPSGGGGSNVIDSLYNTLASGGNSAGNVGITDLGDLSIGQDSANKYLVVRGSSAVAYDGVVPDTSSYAPFGVTRGTSNNRSLPYIVLTRAGKTVFSLGIDKNNQFTIGGSYGIDNDIDTGVPGAPTAPDGALRFLSIDGSGNVNINKGGLSVSGLASASGYSCLQVNSNGNISKTGSACGSGGSSGNVIDNLSSTLGAGNNANSQGMINLGNVGIGTVAGGSVASPMNLSLGATYSSTAGINPKLKLYDAGGIDYYGLGISSGQFDFMVPTNAHYSWNINGAEKVRIDTNGNVGIGTISPGAKLDVNGSLVLSGATNNFIYNNTKDANNNSTIYYQSSASNANTGFYTTGNSATNYGSLGAIYGNGWTNNNIRLNHDGTNGNIVTGSGNLVLSPSSGKVGVGLTSPACKLDVNGDICSNGVSVSAGGKKIISKTDSDTSFIVPAGVTRIAVTLVGGGGGGGGGGDKRDGGWGGSGGAGEAGTILKKYFSVIPNKSYNFVIGSGGGEGGGGYWTGTMAGVAHGGSGGSEYYNNTAQSAAPGSSGVDGGTNNYAAYSGGSAGGGGGAGGRTYMRASDYYTVMAVALGGHGGGGGGGAGDNGSMNGTTGGSGGYSSYGNNKANYYGGGGSAGGTHSGGGDGGNGTAGSNLDGQAGLGAGNVANSNNFGTAGLAGSDGIVIIEW